MPCAFPVLAYQVGVDPKTGRRRLVFRPPNGGGEAIPLPCNKCANCLVERSRQWSIRLNHEAEFWDDSIFLTLTYRKAPKNLIHRHVQLFLKRLRKDSGKKISYFCAGEYGKKNARPHYHLIMFGFKPCCRIEVRHGDSPIYTCSHLEKLWGRGFISFGDVTPQSSAYVAQYCLGKLEKNKDAKLRPEYICVSTKPAIGKRWIEKNKEDVYLHNSVVSGDRVTKPPAYYDKQLEKYYGIAGMAELKLSRRERGEKITYVENGEKIQDGSLIRRAQSEKVLLAKLANRKPTKWR